MGDHKKYFYKGDLLTINKISLISGCNAPTLKKYIESGMTAEEAVNVIVAKSDRYKIRIRDISATVPEWSRMTGTEIYTIRKRLAMGWDVKSAVFAPKGTKTFNREVYANEAESEFFAKVAGEKEMKVLWQDRHSSGVMWRTSIVKAKDVDEFLAKHKGSTLLNA